MTTTPEEFYIESPHKTGKVITPTHQKLDVVTPDGRIKISDIDSVGRAGANSIFGDKIVGQKVPSLSYQYNYGYRDRDFIVSELNGGAVSSSNSQIYLNTGIDAAGAAKASSVGYLRYIPGHEAYALFTVVYSIGVAGSYQRAGIYDDDDGFFIGYEGSDFCITRRRAGVDSRQVIDLAGVFQDFNPNMGNVYKISFGYLGFANITFECLATNGEWVTIGRFNYPNTSQDTHITNTNLPIRGEVANTGNTTDIWLSSGSVSAGIIDGAGTDPSARAYTYERGTVATLAGDNMLVALRNIDTYNGKENRVDALVQLLSAATEGNKPVKWSIVFNPTVTNTPTWAKVDADSIIEYSTDATITYGTGIPGVSWNMAKADSFFEDVEGLGGRIRPGDIAVVVVSSTGASET
ncbi:MAG: hypothetical protein RI591_07920, partial [Dehalococcoidia bacterium]|nr:hypothetical protein [Dehalococcoidia bacterium]